LPSDEPDRRPLRPDVILVLGSLAGASLGAYVLLSALSSHPGLALVLVFSLGLVASFGVIVGLGSASATRRPRRKRNWVRFIGQSQLLYEERSLEGDVRTLAFPCARAVLGPHGMSGWDVIVPPESEWDSHVPAWAGGRRADILQRIVAVFGGGTRFRFRSAAEQQDEADKATRG
jgi:hypothetical protein